VVQEGQLVVLESTTYPGTTRELLVPVLEGALDAERRRDPQSSPSHRSGVDPGRVDFTLKNTPKVVGGITNVCTTALSSSIRACATTSWRGLHA